jgi:hypothetical protein
MGVLNGELSFHDALDNLERMPKQKELITAMQPYAAYVGGEGSGKSVALMMDCILNAAAEDNGLTLVGRLNANALETSTMRTFLELIPPEYGEWKPTAKEFSFHNGHQVWFRHLDISDPKTVGHIKSMNLSRAYVDEATEVSEEIFFVLAGRIRRKTTTRHTIKLASNPAGHDWIWRRFFDPERAEKWRRLSLGITASSFDNCFLPADYLANRINLYPADWADRFIYGHFSDFSDLVYKEFTEPTHVYDANREWAIFGGRTNPPPSWPVIVGIDIGSDIDPWAIGITSVAPNGMLFQFEEVYGNSMLIKNIADELKLKLQLGCGPRDVRPVDGMAYDYANRQAALELAEHDIGGTPAIKEVRPGLFKCAQYMHVDPRLSHPFNSKVKGSPRFFVSSVCMNTRREISAYKWGKDRSGNSTGEPSHENSHSPDQIRYQIHTFRPLPDKLKPPEKWENPSLDAMSRQYWKEAATFPDRMDKLSPKGERPKTMAQWQKQATSAPRRFQRSRGLHFRRA